MKFLTTAEVAELLRLKPGTVSRMAKYGEIPHIRIGRKYLFEEDRLWDFLNANRVHCNGHHPIDRGAHRSVSCAQKGGESVEEVGTELMKGICSCR